MKSFQLKGASPLTPHQRLCPWTPLGAITSLLRGSDPRHRLALHVLAIVRRPWQILDPPLKG